MSFDSRCPRKLKSAPQRDCQEGKKAVDLARNAKEGGCPYFIQDRESHYCFFLFMQQNGRPIDTAKIARLLLMDDEEVKKIISNFKKKIAEADKSHE